MVQFTIQIMTTGQLGSFYVLGGYSVFLRHCNLSLRMLQSLVVSRWADMFSAVSSLAFGYTVTDRQTGSLISRILLVKLKISGCRKVFHVRCNFVTFQLKQVINIMTA